MHFDFDPQHVAHPAHRPHRSTPTSTCRTASRSCSAASSSTRRAESTASVSSAPTRSDHAPTSPGIAGRHRHAGRLPLSARAGRTARLPPARVPAPFVADQYRLVGALYADAQWRPVAKLALDAGVRVQKGFGGAALRLDAALLGRRRLELPARLPPQGQLRHRLPPAGVQQHRRGAGRHRLRRQPQPEERASQSFQGELNARLLRNVRKVRELELRVDYSYTFLDNLISDPQRHLQQPGTRAIHSVEGYGQALPERRSLPDRRRTPSSTRITSDVGVIRNAPNHWLSLGARRSTWSERLLDVNANLLVTGAYDDPNRYPSSANPLPCAGDHGTALRTTDLTFDRLTPVALLQLGFRLRFLQRAAAASAGSSTTCSTSATTTPTSSTISTPSDELSADVRRPASASSARSPIASDPRRNHATRSSVKS